MIRPEGKQITHFFGVFFPLLLTQFALVGSSLFSSIFSGNAGTTDLAGVAVAANIWYPLFAGACGIAFGISPIIAQLRGARKTEDIPVFITQGIYTSFFLTVIIVTCRTGYCRTLLAGFIFRHFPYVGTGDSALRRRCPRNDATFHGRITVQSFYFYRPL